MEDLVDLMDQLEDLMGSMDHVKNSACRLDLVLDVDTIEIMSFLNIFNDTIVPSWLTDLIDKFSWEACADKVSRL